MAGTAEQSATALCRFCFVALCKDHLVELYSNPPNFPQYSCRHTPGAPRHEQDHSGRRVETPERTPVRLGRLVPGLRNA